MASIKLADFGLGIDTRRSAASSNPHSFRDIVNCHITTGHTLKRRGGFKHIADLPLDTAGLLPHNGALNIFKVTANANGLVTLPAADNVAHINGDTTPIKTLDIERTSTSKSVLFTYAPVSPFFHRIEAWNIRRIHFADVFHASPYIIAEHWDGSKSHHYLNGQPLVDRVQIWQEVAGVDNNWLAPSNALNLPFIFKVVNADPMTTEPYWGLKNFANREQEKWLAKAAASEAAYHKAKVPAVTLAPEAHPLFLKFHGGGVLPPALGAISFVGLDPLQAPVLSALGLTISKDVRGALTFAENVALQAKYLTMINNMQQEYDTLLSSQSGYTNVLQGTLNSLQSELIQAKAAYKTASDKLSGNDYRGKALANAKKAKENKKAAMDAAQQKVNTYIATSHTDGGVNANVQAAVTLSKWKMENYIAMIAGRIAAAAPALAVGDAVWLNPRFAYITNPLLLENTNSLANAYAVAHDQNSTGYTQIKDQDLDQNGTVAVNIASKLFIGVGDQVRFCQTGNPTRWFFDDTDEELDTGWLPVGNQLSGSREVTGLGQHLGKLAVFFDDAAQIWTVDPDPQRMAFQQVIEGVGTSFPKSISNIGNDVTFLHRTGFRSIAAMQYNNNLTDTDSGSSIDKLITAFIDSTVLRQDFDGLTAAAPSYATINQTEIISKTLSTLGQYWCAVGKDVFVLTFSKAAQITGWSRYTLPFEVDDIAEMKGTVYVRARNRLYAYDAQQLNDDIDAQSATQAAIQGKAAFHFLNAKTAGRMKMFHSMDATINGEADISFLYDARNPAATTLPIPLSGDSNPSFLTPMQVSSTHIAPVITSSKHFELEYLAFYYNLLGRR